MSRASKRWNVTPARAEGTVSVKEKGIDLDAKVARRSGLQPPKCLGAGYLFEAWQPKEPRRQLVVRVCQTKAPAKLLGEPVFSYDNQVASVKSWDS